MNRFEYARFFALIASILTGGGIAITGDYITGGGIIAASLSSISAIKFGE